MTNEDIESDAGSSISLAESARPYMAVPIAIIMAAVLICKTWLSIANKQKER